ncbi:MAG: FliG C-terminal domain-containing protein [Pirellulaceae bacterium]
MITVSGRMPHTDALRKAAIVIATLDVPAADALLARMTPEQAAQIRAALMELDDVVTEERDTVLREFLQRDAVGWQTAEAGVELDAQLARRIGVVDGPAEPRADAPAVPAGQAQWFEAILSVPVDALARHLERQHPQVAALVVAHFPPGRAAAVIDRFPARLQTDVLRRVAELDTIDPEVVHDVALELEQMLGNEIRQARQRSAGLSTVAAIVRAAGPQRRGLLGSLEQHDQALAHELEQHGPPVKRHRSEKPSPSPVSSRQSPRTAARATGVDTPSLSDVLSSPGGLETRALPLRSESPRGAPNDRASDEPSAIEPHDLAAPDSPSGTPGDLPEFNELMQLSDEAWALLFRELEPQVVLLALAGADEKWMKRISRRLSARDARELQRRLDSMGPTQLHDIDRAQRRMVQRAVELAERGQIAWPRSHDRKTFAAAA